MRYKVVYPATKKETRAARQRFWRMQICASVFFLLFALCVHLFYPAGKELIREYLLPEEEAAAVWAEWVDGQWLDRLQEVFQGLGESSG